MKKLKIYIDTMYKPAYFSLVAAFSALAFALGKLAVTLNYDILAGESDVLFRYPPMIEQIVPPFLMTFGICLLIDFNERKRKK